MIRLLIVIAVSFLIVTYFVGTEQETRAINGFLADARNMSPEIYRLQAAKVRKIIGNRRAKIAIYRASTLTLLVLLYLCYRQYNYGRCIETVLLFSPAQSRVGPENSRGMPEPFPEAPF